MARQKAPGEERERPPINYHGTIQLVADCGLLELPQITHIPLVFLNLLCPRPPSPASHL